MEFDSTEDKNSGWDTPRLPGDELESLNTVEQKSPTKSFEQKSPTKTFEQKSPTKSFEQKSPTKPFEQKSPTKNVESPAKTFEQTLTKAFEKSQTKTFEQTTPPKASPRKTNLYSNNSPLKTIQGKTDSSPTKTAELILTFKEELEKKLNSQKPHRIAPKTPQKPSRNLPMSSTSSATVQKMTEDDEKQNFGKTKTGLHSSWSSDSDQKNSFDENEPKNKSPNDSQHMSPGNLILTTKQENMNYFVKRIRSFKFSLFYSCEGFTGQHKIT